MSKSSCAALATAVVMALPVCGVAGSYATNFDSFALGPVDGQYGWVNDNYGYSAVDPLIVSDPTGDGTEGCFGSIPPRMSWTIPGRVHSEGPVI